jgi:hypothetical protein
MQNSPFPGPEVVTSVSYRDYARRPLRPHIDMLPYAACGFHLICFGFGAFGSTISTSPLSVFFLMLAQIKPPTAKTMMMPSGTPMPIEACVVSFDIVGRWVWAVMERRSCRSGTSRCWV